MGAGLFGAFIQGMISLSTANKHDRYIRLGIEMILSFALSLAGTWATVGLTVLKATQSPLMAITTGFLTGLGVGAGAAYIRFINSEYSKGLGLTVPNIVAEDGQAIQDHGVNVQRAK